jgi:hypothetical protein
VARSHPPTPPTIINQIISADGARLIRTDARRHTSVAAAADRADGGQHDLTLLVDIGSSLKGQ